MKNLRHNRLLRAQRLYHKSHQWSFRRGLYIPHSYEEGNIPVLTWWDDVGFILNRRRVIVWWQHPRLVYADEIKRRALAEVGPGPQEDWITAGCTKNYRKVGVSRKRVTSYTSLGPAEAQRAHYTRVSEAEKRLTTIGIDYEVRPSWRRESLDWSIGITLISPMEVRGEKDLVHVASLARQLILGETTLGNAFPGYVYNFGDWLVDQKILQSQSL